MKVRSSHLDRVSYYEWGDWSISNAYLPENLEEKKVYVYYNDNNVVYLQYDFCLEVRNEAPIDGFANYDPEVDYTNTEVISINSHNRFGIDNLNSLKSGIYLLTITYSNNTKETIKLMKK